jgi:hypothetical protein
MVGRDVVTTFRRAGRAGVSARPPRRRPVAVGDERLGSRLNDLASDALRALHDQRLSTTLP